MRDRRSWKPISPTLRSISWSDSAVQVWSSWSGTSSCCSDVDASPNRAGFIEPHPSPVGSYVAIESGWTTTEVGRQPWIVYNLMRVDDAVTTAPGSFVWAMLAVLLVVYAVIAIIFVTVLLGLVTRWRHEDERQLVRAPEAGAPYGPRPELAADGSVRSSP